MKYDELMVDLGKRFELKDFRPDEDGYCEIYADDFTVTFQHVPETDMVLTTCLVCELGPEPSAKFYRRLLEANFMYKETHGATLSIDPEAETVMLSRYDRLGQIDGESFYRTVEMFMVVMLTWKDWFKYDAKNVDKPQIESMDDTGVIRG